MSELMYMDGDVFVIDGERYSSVNGAYEAFRRLYNKSLGKASKRRIGNVTTRKYLISHRGMDFAEEYRDSLNEEFADSSRVKCRILGILGISYCYLFGEQDFDASFREWDDDKRERYIDWLMCAGTSAVRMFGRMDKLVVTKRGKLNVGRYVSHKRKHTKKR